MRNDKIKALKKRYIKEGYKLAKKQLLKERHWSEELEDEIEGVIFGIRESVDNMEKILQNIHSDKRGTIIKLICELDDIQAEVQTAHKECENDLRSMRRQDSLHN